MCEMRSEERARKRAQEMRLMHDTCREARLAAYQARKLATNALVIATMAMVLAGIAILIARV